MSDFQADVSHQDEFDPLARVIQPEVHLLSPDTDEFDPLAAGGSPEVDLLGPDEIQVQKRTEITSVESESFDPLAPQGAENGNSDPFDDLLGDFGAQVQPKTNGERLSSASSVSENEEVEEIEEVGVDLKQVIDSTLHEHDSADSEHEVQDHDVDDFSKPRDWSEPTISEDIREETDEHGNLVQVRKIIRSFPDGREEVETERKVLRKQITEFVTLDDIANDSDIDEEALEAEEGKNETSDSEPEVSGKPEASEFQGPTVKEDIHEELDADGNTVKVRTVTRTFADGQQETETERVIVRRQIQEFISLEQLEEGGDQRQNPDQDTVQRGIAEYRDEQVNKPYLPHYMRGASSDEDSKQFHPRNVERDEDKYKTGKRWQPPPKDEHVDLLLPTTGPVPVYSARGTRPVTSVSAEEYEQLDIVNRDEDELRRMEEEELPPEKITTNLIQQFRSMDSKSGDTSIYKTGKRWQPPPREEGVDIPLPTDLPPSARDRPLRGVSRLPQTNDEPREIVNRSEDDPREEEELPPQDITKGRLAMFRQLEAETGGSLAPSPQRKPPTRPRTPPRENPMKNAPEDVRVPARSTVLQASLPKTESQPTQKATERRRSADSDSSLFADERVVLREGSGSPEPEGRIAENTPETREGVVRESDDTPEEELPSVGFTSSLLNKFKSMEVGNKPPPLPSTQPKRESQAIKPTFVYVPPQAKSNKAADTTPVQNNENTEIVNEESVVQPEGGVYESDPQRRPDVLREVDNDTEVQELPEEGQSRSLIAQWSQRVNDSFRKQEEATPPKRGQNSRWNVRTTGYIGTQATIKPADSESSLRMSSSDVSEISEPRDNPVSENTPVLLPDVVRESDRQEEEDLPTSGFARNMLKRYQETVANHEKETKSSRKQYVRKS